MMNSTRELELYVHIPFCAKKCAYCDFNSYAAPERMHREYTEKLIEEIIHQSVSYEGYRVTSVFLGGGTPSILSASYMREILAALRAGFDIDHRAEITLEANPGTLTMEKLETYREGGVNRLSIGLQSANDDELKILGRIHSYDEFLKSYQRARQAGFNNISVDLMSGLPGQTVTSWKHTLKKVMMLKPEHISAYSLIVEEGTPFYQRYHTHPELLPDEDADREMYHLTKEVMAEQGYERYEISNYAKPGFECYHNCGYWTGREYLGIGLGASSYTFGYRFHNVEDLKEYMSLNMKEPGAPYRDIQELTLNDRMEEFMFLGLRMMHGVSGSEFLGRFGQNMWNIYAEVLPKLEEQGLIKTEAPYVKLTEPGIDVSNYVLSEFLLD